MDTEQRPVLAGLLALAAVAVVVGLLGGLAVLAGTSVFGIGGGDGATVAQTPENSLYLPKPSKTQEPSGPLITLPPGSTPTPSDGASEGSGSDDGKKKQKRREKATRRISLSAGQTSVSAMERIDLTGVYPGGEGAILQVQRLEGGTWTDFPVTASVSNETFSTYVMTSQAGSNRFRVVDTDSERASNPVTVTVG